MFNVIFSFYLVEKFPATLPQFRDISIPPFGGFHETLNAVFQALVNRALATILYLILYLLLHRLDWRWHRFCY